MKLTFLTLLFQIPFVYAEVPHQLKAPPLGFFVGSYELIGQEPDSGLLYSGVLTMVEDQGRLKVARRVNGQTVNAEAKIGRVVEDVAALRINFSQGGKQVMATFQIDGDWNNYARLTGYLEIKGSPNTKPGREALFYSEQLSSEMPNQSLKPTAPRQP